MAFIQRFTIRFDEVDFAQVVYFPRFFHYCHRAFEDFFAQEVKVPYARMLQERKVGFPAKHAESDFRAPLRFGDTCRLEMETLRVGTSSITCRYRLYRGETSELCAELEIVTVAISMGAFAPVALPEDVRAAFLAHRAPGEPVP